MSEGRTPTATLTQQRQLAQKDIDILHQIVIRAQNDPASEAQPKDALLEAYNNIYNERNLSHREDRVCVDILFKLLDPATPGESLYHKFENVLQECGIVLAFDDDATTQDGGVDWVHKGDEAYSVTRSPARFTRPIQRPALRPVATLSTNFEVGGHTPPRPHSSYTTHNMTIPDDNSFINNPPPHIRDLEQQAEQRDRIVLTRQTLEVWRDAAQFAQEQQLDARADALYAIRLKRKVLKQCLAVFQDVRDSQIRADNVYYRRLAIHALGKTRDEHCVRRVASMDDDRVKGLSLYKWTLAARENSFCHARDLLAKRTVLRKLLQCYCESQAHQAHLEDLLALRMAQRHDGALRSAMGVLAGKMTETKENAAKADSQNFSNLGQASLRAWTAKLGQLQNLSLTAEDAREYFLTKRVLAKLRNNARFRKERRTWLAHWTAHRWQTFVKNKKHNRYDELYRQVRRDVKMGLAKRVLRRWQQKVQHMQRDQSQADEFYQASIMKRIAKPMIESTYDVADWVSRSEPIAEAKAFEFLKRRAMSAMEIKQQSLVEMTDRADRLQQYRYEQRAVQGLRQMQLKAFELQRRTFDADAFRQRNNKRVVRNYLADLRRALAERRAGGEGPLRLVGAPAATPARKREELLMYSSTRLSTTPAYTPFAARLRQGPTVLENIDDINEGGSEEMHDGDEDTDEP